MNFKRVDWLLRLASLSLFSLAVLLCLAAPAWSQSSTTGAISGAVTDPTGAAIPGAKVTATSNDTHAEHTTTSQSNGGYNIPLLPPGNYTISVAALGFNDYKQSGVLIGVSAQVGLPVKLTVGAQSTTVEVTAEAPLIEPQNANTTSVVTAAVIENIPDPGNDITFFSVFAPGAYINKSSTGGATFLGGGSAGYTIDGGDYNDPFNNLNDSGATNLLLGANDIAEVSTNTNSYSVDQGRYSAAQINYTSKTGSNNYHGNIQYQWNGRVLNAYDYFSKATPGQTPPKPEDNVNNYAGSVGGPILHNKLFWFFDNEGTFISLPTPESVTFPTPAYQQYTQNEMGLGGYETSSTFTSNNGGSAQNPTSNPYKCLPAAGPNITNGVQPCGVQAASVNEFPFENYYMQNAGLYGVPENRWQGGGSYVMTPDPASGCPLLGGVNPSTGVNQGGSFTTPVQDPSYNPQVQNTGTSGNNRVPSDTGCFWDGTDFGSNHTFEDQFKTRVDWTKSQTDTIWVEFGRDAGEQATGFSPINPILNSDSWQPEWTGGADWTHTFSPTLTNDASANLLMYWAVFGLQNPAADEALMPYQMTVSTGASGLAGTVNTGTGRDIVQYGYVDNLTWTKGQHTFKFGVNFRRDDTNDILYDPNYSDTFSGVDFLFGYTSATSARFPVSTEEPYRSFALDMFAGDTWQIRRNLTLIYGLRATHNSNPKDLQDNLGIVNPWELQGHSLSGPIDAVVHGGSNLWQQVPTAVWQPRLAITWQPRNNTLVKLGWGQFSTIPSTSTLSTLSGNTPFAPSFTGGYGSGDQGANAGTNGCPFNPLLVSTPVCGILDDPSQFYSGYNAVRATNASFQNNFYTGAPSCVYYAINPPTPTVGGVPACVPQNGFTVLEPKLLPSYSQQWSVALQHQFGRQFSLQTQYAGVRSIDGSESFDPLAFQTVCNGCYTPYTYIQNTTTNSSTGNNTGLYSDLDPRWSSWTQTYYQQGQWTTANALEVSATERLQHGIQFDLNYTWAHNMASIANPCLGCAIPAPGHTYSGVDIRNNVNVDYTWSLPFHASGAWWGRLINDWQISGASFLESGSAIGGPSSTSPASPLLQLGAASNNPAVYLAGFENIPVYAKGITFPTCPASNPSCQSISTHTARVQWFYPGAFGNSYDSTNKSCYNPITNQDTFVNGAPGINITCGQFGYQLGAINQPGIETELRGPGFLWTNLFFTKMVTIREGVKLRFDAQLYNLFNHYNLSNASTTAASFQPGTASTAGLNSSLFQAGAVSSGSSPATGLLGSSLGGDTNPRFIAFEGKITF